MLKEPIDGDDMEVLPSTALWEFSCIVYLRERAAVDEGISYSSVRSLSQTRIAHRKLTRESIDIN